MEGISVILSRPKRQHYPAQPTRKRNRRLERTSREIRKLHRILYDGRETVRAVLQDDQGEGLSQILQSLKSASSALAADPTYNTQRLNVQAASLRAELTALGSGIQQCGQNYVDLLEAVAERLEALVTPARYQR